MPENERLSTSALFTAAQIDALPRELHEFDGMVWVMRWRVSFPWRFIDAPKAPVYLDTLYREVLDECKIGDKTLARVAVV
jgi:hypothetical protein